MAAQHLFLSIAIGLFSLVRLGMAQTACLVCDAALEPPAGYGYEQLAESFTRRGWTTKRVEALDNAAGDLVVVVGVAGKSQSLGRLMNQQGIRLPDQPEALAVHKMSWRSVPTLLLCGHDARGLMYAMLDVADRILWTAADEEPLQYV